MTVKKSPDLLYLEELFSDIKRNRTDNHDEQLRMIAKVLKRRYNINVDIHIIDNDMKFFGMSIYPDRTTIDKIVDSIVENKSRLQTIEKIWAKNTDWTIEIDSKLLWDPSLNANPSEIVAVLLHEIGHVIYSNKIPVRVHKVLSYSLMKVPLKVKKVFTWSKAQRLLGLSIIEACATSSFHTGLKEELEADKFVIKEGYRDALYNFMNKLLKTQGNANLNIPESEAEKNVEMMVQWAIVNTSELNFRKTKLKNNINNEIRNTKSFFVRSYLLNIHEEFFGKNHRTRYDELIAEQMLDKQFAIASDIIQEGFRDWFNKQGEVKKISQADIDIIQVEIDRIQNEDDRIYVLDLIYDKLDIIELSLDLLKDENTAKRVKVSKQTLLNQQEQLNRLRAQVLKMKVTPMKYGAIIRYPEGYEG